MTSKSRIDRLAKAQKMNREAEVICVKRSGERESMKWLDAISAAIKRDSSINHFEDAPGFKLCSELPNAIIGYDGDKAAERTKL